MYQAAEKQTILPSCQVRENMQLVASARKMQLVSSAGNMQLVSSAGNVLTGAKCGKHDKLEPRFYCESGVERRIHKIFVGDYN